MTTLGDFEPQVRDRFRRNRLRAQATGGGGPRGGPTLFLGTVTRLLVDHGYDPRAIRAEDFGTKDAAAWRAADAREPKCRTGENSIQGGAG
jgi:hypothetical protein